MSSYTYICALLTGDWPNGTYCPGIKGKTTPRRAAPAQPFIPGLGERYARVLFNSVEKYAPGAEMILYTDKHRAVDCEQRVIPKRPGYCWEKLNVFREDEFPVGSRVLYTDLDVVFLHNLTPLLTVPLDHPVFLDDRGPNGDWNRRLGAGLFSFEVNERYFDLPNIERDEFDTDEQFFEKHCSDWVAWQDIAPGRVMSYKWDFLRRNQPMDEVCLMYFWGEPRPHRVDMPWNPHSPQPTKSP